MLNNITINLLQTLVSAKITEILKTEFMYMPTGVRYVTIRVLLRI